MSPKSGVVRHVNKQKNLLILFIHTFTTPARGKAKSQGPTHTPQVPIYIHAENTCFLPHIHLDTHGHRHTYLHTFLRWTSNSGMKSEVQAPFSWQVGNTESHRNELQTELPAENPPSMGIYCPAWVPPVRPSTPARQSYRWNQLKPSKIFYRFGTPRRRRKIKGDSRTGSCPRFPENEGGDPALSLIP